MVNSNLIGWLPFGAAMIVCAELKKEHSRGGKRKEIIQTDDEEEAKKVSSLAKPSIYCSSRHGNMQPKFSAE